MIIDIKKQYNQYSMQYYDGLNQISEFSNEQFSRTIKTCKTQTGECSHLKKIL